MKSVNNCVQEFIDHHSSSLFPNDHTTDTRRPRISRFNSIPSSSIDIEDEDPSLFRYILLINNYYYYIYVDLFVITPPIEYYLDVSSRLCREQFFKVIFH